MSTPETPSTSAWWLLPTIAKRSSRQALDQPQLPERLAAVELLGEDPRGEVAQLLVGARRRQRGLAHVVVEVEVGVVDPDRPALVEGDEAQLLAEARHQVQARGDVVAELRVGGRRRLRRRSSRRRACGRPARSMWRKEVSSPVSRFARHAFIFAHDCQAPNALNLASQAICTPAAGMPAV